MKLSKIESKQTVTFVHFMYMNNIKRFERLLPKGKHNF
jgi:hypothetical protein